MSTMPSDYQERAQNMGLADPNDILTALIQPDVVFLDVRSDKEIKETGTVVCAGEVKTSECTADQCPDLARDPAKVVGIEKDKPIVVYCGSGRRANEAKKVLTRNGYRNVMNAGGYEDINYIIETQM